MRLPELGFLRQPQGPTQAGERTALHGAAGLSQHGLGATGTGLSFPLIDGLPNFPTTLPPPKHTHTHSLTRSFFIAQAGLASEIHLPLSPGCWDSSSGSTATALKGPLKHQPVPYKAVGLPLYCQFPSEGTET